MQKLQQQLSDTSGLERGGGLAVVLANYWGEWTTFNADLQDGELDGRYFSITRVDILRVYRRHGALLECAKYWGNNSPRLNASS